MLYSRKSLSVLRPPESMFYLMRVHVVSDVHGTADALKTAGDGADMLIFNSSSPSRGLDSGDRSAD